MPGSEVAVFWSYSHEDDSLDGGAIVKLAQSLRDEFALVTGETLTLFIDRDGIGWGDEWRRRIDVALAETTFFVPIVSPRYFTRLECRRELLEFSSYAQSLGVSELILPIRYAIVKDLSEDNPDEVVAMVARMQYVDWTQLRLQEPTSSEYRIAVNRLAGRLAKLTDDISERQLLTELQEVREPEDDELGLSDLFERINEILPTWIQAIDDVQVDFAQLQATFEVYSERIMKAKRSGPPSALFASLQRLASDEIPIAERSLQRAKTYMAQTIELDPLVLNAARIGEDHPADRALFADLHSAVLLAYKTYTDSMIRPPGTVDPETWTAQWVHTSRAMRRFNQVLAVYSQTVTEAHQIVATWVRQFEWLT